MAIYSNVSGVGAGLIKGVDGISINKIRSINAALSSAFALLLDESYGSGAEAAYSVRRISGVYNGPLMVIRRDSDDATLEVGFNSSNDIDSSAIEVHCAGTTCYVTEWRDQSSNGNDATQGIETNQPTIYTGGALVKEGGRVKILPNDAGDGFSSIAVDMSGSTISMFSLCTAEANNSIMVHFGGSLGERIFTATSGSSLSDGSYSGITGGTVYFDGVSQTAMKTRGEIYTQFYQNQTLGSYVGFSQLNGTSINLSGNSNYWSMYGMQEIIFYTSDKSTDRTSIESNIGDYYTQTTPLLDTYSGAAAAYSLRKLSSSYSGPLVRVREDGGDTQADIYANVFGELDTVSLAAHCGSNNGFVVSWLDQSGSSNTATQPADANQPKIYDGTTGVVTENGKPVIKFLEQNWPHLTASGFGTGNTRFVSYVAKMDAEPSVGSRYSMPWIFMESPINTVGDYLQINIPNITNSALLNFPTNSLDVSSASATNIQRLISANKNAAGSEMWFDGTSQGTGSGAQNMADGLSIGRFSNYGQGIMSFQEMIIYNSDQSSNRTGIESNINNFYDIFPGTELIDEYSGAAAAYSLRSLSEQYDGAVVTVRRDSDDAQKNIYTLSDGQIDTNALEGFCGKSDGFVVSWLDQSSNSNNATQPADVNQPKIYDGTTGVETSNGKPAVRFINSSTTYLDAPYIGTDTTTTYFEVHDRNGSNLNVWSPDRNENAVCADGQNWISGAFYNGVTALIAGTLKQPTTPVDIQDYRLVYWLRNGTNSELGVNASSVATGTQSSSVLNRLRLGTRSGLQSSFDGYMSEFVMYQSDQSANRTGIEENINENYLIYQPRTSPTSGLLADYSGAAAAYSLRQLSNKAVMAVKVRRDSDDAQVNIGFVGGDLDTVSLSAFCGTSDGFVVEWVDQSTNGNHADQPADTQQPKIYDGGSQRVITENGKPTVQFNGSKAINIGNYSSLTEGELFISVRHITPPDNTYNGGWKISSQSQNMHWPYYTGTIYDNFGSTTRYSFTPSISLTQLNLYNSVSTSSEWTARLNSSVETTSATNTVGFSSGVIGQTSPSLKMSHNISEYILYDSAQSSTDRTNIEDNIFSHYSPAPLLDTYSGAAAAYSLRKLSSSATNAVQVRRDSDDATQYIGFVQDVFNGQSLDTAALSAFCGSANGYVTEWVDQSSNSNNATQPADVNQPKIYDGTSGVVTENGKPAVDFGLISTSFYLNYTDSFTGTKADFSIYAVSKTTSTGTKQTIWGEETYFLLTPNGGFRINGGSNNISMTAAVVNAQELRTANLVESTAAYVVSVNGTATSGTGTWTTINRGSNVNLGRRSNNTWFFSGLIQEVVVYQSDQSASRTDIEDNINTFYDIY